MTATTTAQRAAPSEQPGGTAVGAGVNASFRRSLALITVLGAVWRLGYLIFAKADEALRLNDGLYYSIQASLNADGRWFEDGLTEQPGAEHGMLTSLYLTPSSLPAGDAVLRQRFALTVVGIATIAVVGLTGRRLAMALADATTVRRWRTAELVGLVAAAIVATYPNFWIHNSVIMSESLVLLLVSLALYVAIGHHRNPTIRSAVTLGVLAGLGALTRSELVLLIPGFAIVSAMRCRRRRRPIWPAVTVLFAGVATLLPWSIYNTARFEESVFLSTNDGSTLLGANCHSSYYVDVGGWDLLCLAPLEPVGIGHDEGEPDASERSLARRERALVFINSHVERLPVVMAARIGRTLDVYGLSSLVRHDAGDDKDEWVSWAGIVGFWVLAPLAFAGWVALSRRRVSERWWLAVPVVEVLVTVALYYGAHRLRAAAEPTIVLLAAIALVVYWERLTARRSRSRESA
jgi:hypothetical protein